MTFLALVLTPSIIVEVQIRKLTSPLSKALTR